MQFADYLVSNNQQAVSGFLQSIGYQFNQYTPEEAKYCLADHITKNGVAQVLPLHPDYELIKEELEILHKTQDQTVQAKIIQHPASDTGKSSSFEPPGLESFMQGVNPSLANVFLFLGCLYLLIQIIRK